MQVHDSMYEMSADLYDDLLVKQRFRNPARDLIAAMNIQPSSLILDVGTGTGVALFFILKALEGQGVVIGIDPSEEMLQIAKRNGAPLLIVGGLPNTNFLENTFDAISANFVISHIQDYGAALSELQKILKKDGTLGVTFWREGQTEYNKIWNQTIKKYINETYLSILLKQSLPWEQWFEDPHNIQTAFREAGFSDIDIIPKEYHVQMLLDDYLECRYALLSGKYLQNFLSAQHLKAFKTAIYKAFYEKVGKEITYIGRVNIVLTKKS